MSLRQRLARLERGEEQRIAGLDELIDRCVQAFESVRPEEIDDELYQIARECHVSEDAVRGIYRAVLASQEDER